MEFGCKNGVHIEYGYVSLLRKAFELGLKRINRIIQIVFYLTYLNKPFNYSSGIQIIRKQNLFK